MTTTTITSITKYRYFSYNCFFGFGQKNSTDHYNYLFSKCAIFSFSFLASTNTFLNENEKKSDN